MVDMTAPVPKDLICDPACGTAGFLIAASEYLRTHHAEAIYKNEESRRKFNGGTFPRLRLRQHHAAHRQHEHAAARCGEPGHPLQGFPGPSGSGPGEHDEEKYSLILANPPFTGSLDYESTAKDLLQIVKTKKTELLFLALFLSLLSTGGRAAVIVPDGVLFGSSKAHKALRKILIEDQKLDAVVSMPSGVFKPYAGVSTAILLFTKTNRLDVSGAGGTDQVWFYDMQADGFSLDDRRTPQPDKSDLPDILARWQAYRAGDWAEAERKRTDRSFLVPKDEIAGNDYDLSINRYKEVEYEAVEHDAPQEILTRLAKLEEEIAEGRKELERMLE